MVDFGFRASPSAARLLDLSMGGGGILDIGE
jgi:hypothetical protein